MHEDPNFLNETLREVFALVDTEDAISSSREVLERYTDGKNTLIGTIVWAEFQLNNQFVRGGVSDIGSMETRSILKPRDHPAIEKIAALALGDGLTAGSILHAEPGEGFYWCIPYTPFSDAKVPSRRIRAVLITEQLFFEVIELFNANMRLTRAEKRMVYQLVTGLGPVDAARVDGISVETKRTHLKNANSKLGCSSQADTVRMMLSQLIHILYLCEAETTNNRVLEEFSATYLHDHTRISVQRLSNGRLMRVLELGPSAGKPVLMIHGYLFPFMLLNARDVLFRNNIRLIVPVRNGYLDDQASGALYADDKLIEQTLQDLVAYISSFWSGPVSVIGHATGGFYAMMIAAAYPDVIKNIVVTSLNLMNERDAESSYAVSFLGGIRKLARHNGMYETLVRQFQRTAFSNGKSTRFVLRRLFKGCATDLDALNGAVGAGEAFGWYQSLHAHSVNGIASDFKLVNLHSGKLLANAPVPVTFLHGPDDTFSSVAEIEEYATTNARARVKVLTSGGHLVVASHPDIVWAEIIDALSD